MQIVIDIPKDTYKDIQRKSLEIQIDGDVLENSVLNGTPLPEDAINGDMLLTMFDTATVYGIDEESDCIILCIDNNFYQKFRYSWWNAPYKAESEGEECER